MQKNGRRDVTAVALAAGSATLIALPALADTGPGVDELLEEVARLRDRVGELEARSTATDALSEARAAELRALMGDVLADADGRASLLQSGAMAGHDGGFFIQSADGNFRLNLKGQIQFRYVWSMQENAPVDDNRAGFENSRTRFSFGGHVVDPSIKYFIWAGYTAGGSPGGNSLLLDAWMQKDFDNGWSLRAGQFKLPTWQEWTVSETRQQFVERSILDARYGQLYSQGVMAMYRTDNMRFYGAFSDGIRTWNTPYSTGPSSTSSIYQQSTDFALTARGEYLLQGDWANYGDFNSFQGQEQTFVVGGSAHYQIGESGTADNETEILQFTVDGSFEFGGANVYGAVIYTTLDDEAMVDRDELGILLQGGYFIAEDLELVARYEYGDLDGGGTVTDDLNVVTIGVTRFWNGHGLKWTTDLGFALDEIDAAWGSGSRGFRADTAGEDGQMVLRSQVQLLF